MIWRMLPGGSRKICMTYHTCHGLNLFDTDPAQHLIAAGQDLHDLDRDLSDASDVWTQYTSFSAGSSLTAVRQGGTNAVNRRR